MERNRNRMHFCLKNTKVGNIHCRLTTGIVATYAVIFISFHQWKKIEKIVAVKIGHGPSLSDNYESTVDIFFSIEIGKYHVILHKVGNGV